MTMQKKAKVAAGSAAALAILVAGGLAIALPAQASPDVKSVSVVEPVDATDTDNVQDEVEDGTNDGETADDNGTEVEDGTNDGETADDAETEDTSDDVGGVAVEDGTQD
jgi:hypothetical protein